MVEICDDLVINLLKNQLQMYSLSIQLYLDGSSLFVLWKIQQEDHRQKRLELCQVF